MDNFFDMQIALYTKVQSDLATGKVNSCRIVQAANRYRPLKRNIMLNALVNYNLKSSTWSTLDELMPTVVEVPNG